MLLSKPGTCHRCAGFITSTFTCTDQRFLAHQVRFFLPEAVGLLQRGSPCWRRCSPGAVRRESQASNRFPATLHTRLQHGLCYVLVPQPSRHPQPSNPPPEYICIYTANGHVQCRSGGMRWRSRVVECM
jgi:hypothetical protein